MNYATLTNEQKEFIAHKWKWYCTRTTVPHAAACIAHDYLCETRTRWNARIESNSFAAVLTFLVWQEKNQVTAF
jgi:hypothetical protein